MVFNNYYNINDWLINYLNDNNKNDNNRKWQGETTTRKYYYSFMPDAAEMASQAPSLVPRGNFKNEINN